MRKKTKLEQTKPMGSLEMGGNLAERRKKLKQRSLYRKASEDDEKGFLYTIREEALEVYNYDTFTLTEVEQDKRDHSFRNLTLHQTQLNVSFIIWQDDVEGENKVMSF